MIKNFINKDGKINLKIFLIYFSVFIFFVIDRFFKVLSLENYFKIPINIIGDFFKLNFVKNYYIAFSIPLSGVILNLIVFLIILLSCFLFFSLFKKEEFIKAGCLLFLIFGAISNFIDRIIFGFVVDYFDLEYFTVFNVADVMITGGCIGLIYFYNKKEKKII